MASISTYQLVEFVAELGNGKMSFSEHNHYLVEGALELVRQAKSLVPGSVVGRGSATKPHRVCC